MVLATLVGFAPSLPGVSAGNVVKGTVASIAARNLPGHSKEIWQTAFPDDVKEQTDDKESSSELPKE